MPSRGEWTIRPEYKLNSVLIMRDGYQDKYRFNTREEAIRYFRKAFNEGADVQGLLPKLQAYRDRRLRDGY